MEPITKDYRRDPHREWVAGEGIPYVEGFVVDLETIETKPWPRLGIKGAVVKLDGSGDFLDLWVLDIPPGSSTIPQHHLFEEVVYVIAGHGLATVIVGDKEHTFEWGPRSMFSIPLNAKCRYFNSHGSERALLASTTSFPLVINAFHNDRFVFEDDFEFTERLGEESHFSDDGTMVETGVFGHDQVWTTNFISDLGVFKSMRDDDGRGAGARTVTFLLADGTMYPHMSEIPVGRYKKAHRHEAGFHIFPVTGHGYSLLWPELGAEKQRVDWKHGTVFVPPDQWWHQHFNLSNEPSCYLANFFGNMRYPFTIERRQRYERSESQRGSGQQHRPEQQIESEDEDPEVFELFAKEIQQAGVPLDMPIPTPR